MGGLEIIVLKNFIDGLESAAQYYCSGCHINLCE